MDHVGPSQGNGLEYKQSIPSSVVRKGVFCTQHVIQSSLSISTYRYQYPWVHESSNTLLSLLDEHLDKKKNIPSAARILPPLRKAASDSPILIHCTNAQISSQRGPFKAGRWGSTDRPFKKGRHPHLFGWKLCSQARKILWHACFSRHRPWLNFKSLVYLEHTGQVGQAKDLRQTNGFCLRPMPALTQVARRSPHV